MKQNTLLIVLAGAGLCAGKIREYNLTLQQTWLNLDGKGRACLTVDTKTPGPVLEIDEGDTLRVNVINKMLIEAALHWHGIYQRDSMWQDGVPGVTQWPLEPRSAYTYEMTVNNQSGIYWYHGHFGAVLMDGQRGALWVRPSPSRPRPYKLISENEDDIEAMRAAEFRPQHIMLADWYDDDVEVQAIQYRDTGVEPACAASIIFNDKGRRTCHSHEALNQYDPDRRRNSLGCLPPPFGRQFVNEHECTATDADMAVFEAKDGERYMFMNFIHGGSHHELRVSIDEHDMWIVAADGDFVKPKKVQAFNINMAERISVLVKLDQKAGNYAIRATSLSLDQIIEGVSILRYPGVSEVKDHDKMTVPQSRRHVDLAGHLLGGSHMVDEMADLAAFPARRPPPHADHTFKFAVNQTTPSAWVIASEPHQGFRQQMPPIMWNDGSMGPTSFGGLKNGTTIDIIFENYAHGMHPFHKHNHKVFIIGKGLGFFKWKDVATALKESPKSFNMIDPPLRDEWKVGDEHGAWTVVRYTIDFPALSMLHCHKIAHFMGGQQIILAEAAELMPPPPEHVKGLAHVDFVPPFRYGPLD